MKDSNEGIDFRSSVQDARRQGVIEEKNTHDKRNSKYRRLYGMAFGDYDRMLREQNGVCAICDGVDPSGRNLSVDHSHKTGKVRGLLCTSCNTNLGYFEKYKDKMLDYLEWSQ